MASPSSGARPRSTASHPDAPANARHLGRFQSRVCPGPRPSGPPPLSSAGTVATSAARTAKPSAAVLANGGTASSATTSVASTQPRASSRSTASGSRRGQAARMRARASSSGISAIVASPPVSDQLLALHEVGEEGAELGTEVLPLDGQLDGGPQIVELLPDVVAAFL